ncbi:MAG: NAD(+)/NADH kinase [Acidimicrobiia bacterium]
MVSLGGDGTMLLAVDLCYEAGVPVLGVNVGQLGYLAEVEPVDFDAALGRASRSGDCAVAERMVLQISVTSAGPRRALVRTERGGAREAAPAGSCASGSPSTARSSPPMWPTA